MGDGQSQDKCYLYTTEKIYSVDPHVVSSVMTHLRSHPVEQRIPFSPILTNGRFPLSMLHVNQHGHLYDKLLYERHFESTQHARLSHYPISKDSISNFRGTGWYFFIFIQK